MRFIFLVCLVMFVTSPVLATNNNNDVDLKPSQLFKSIALKPDVEAVLKQNDPKILKAKIVELATVLHDHKWAWLKRIADKMGFELPESDQVTSTFGAKIFSMDGKVPTANNPIKVPAREGLCTKDDFKNHFDVLLQDCSEKNLKAYLGTLLRQVMYYDVLHLSFNEAPESLWKEAEYVPTVFQEVPEYCLFHFRDCYRNLWASRFELPYKHMLIEGSKDQLVMGFSHRFSEFEGAEPSTEAGGWGSSAKILWNMSPCANQHRRFKNAPTRLKLVTPISRLMRWAISTDFPAILDPNQELRIRYLGLFSGIAACFQHATTRQQTEFTGFEVLKAKPRVEKLKSADQVIQAFVKEEKKSQEDDKVEVLRIKHERVEQELKEQIESLKKKLKETEQALGLAKDEASNAKANSGKVEASKAEASARVEAQLSEARNEKRALEEQIKILRTRANRLEGNLEEKQKELQTTNREFSQLKARTEKSSDAEKKAIEGRITNLQVEINILRGHKQNQAEEIGRLQQELKEARELAQKAQGEVRALQRLEAQKSKKKEKAGKLKQQLEEMKKKLEAHQRLEGELSNAKKTIEKQQKQLDEAKDLETEAQDDDVHMAEQERIIQELRDRLQQSEKTNLQWESAYRAQQEQIKQLELLLKAGDETLDLIVNEETFRVPLVEVVDAKRRELFAYQQWRDQQQALQAAKAKAE